MSLPSSPLWNLPTLNPKTKNIVSGPLTPIEVTGGQITLKWEPPINTGGADVDLLEYEVSMWEQGKEDQGRLFTKISLHYFKKRIEDKDLNDKSILRFDCCGETCTGNLNRKSCAELEIHYRIGLNSPMNDYYLKYNTEYFFRVRAINSASLCEAIAEVSMSTIDSVTTELMTNPTTVRDPGMTGRTGGAINISWIAPEDSGGIPLSYYVLEVQTPDIGGYQPLCKIPALTHFRLTDTGYYRNVDVHDGMGDYVLEKVGAYLRIVGRYSSLYDANGNKRIFQTKNEYCRSRGTCH